VSCCAEESHIGLIAEGQGDAISLPLLLRRWLVRGGDYRDMLGKPAICNGRDRATVTDGVERYVAAVTARPGCRSVLLVLDTEGDSACDLGPKLLARVQSTTRLPVAIALAERNWEDWLYASIETLEIGPDLQYDVGSHGIAVIKQALKPAKYVKPTWQPRLTAKMDIELAISRSPSLGRMLEKFDELVQRISLMDPSA
jgi:hypothetical protein